MYSSCKIWKKAIKMPVFLFFTTLGQILPQRPHLHSLAEMTNADHQLPETFYFIKMSSVFGWAMNLSLFCVRFSDKKGSLLAVKCLKWNSCDRHRLTCEVLPWWIPLLWQKRVIWIPQKNWKCPQNTSKFFKPVSDLYTLTMNP